METTSKLKFIHQKPKFGLGRLLITPSAHEAIEESNDLPLDFLNQHTRGDWGEVCQEDAEENALALREGFRLLSAYRTSLGVRLWIITEADRSATTILLPEEY